MNIKKMLYIALGFISTGLGAVGTVVPLLPTVPFLLLAAFCFARSSEKLDTWFKGTNLYKNNLESYAKGEGMTKKTKIKILTLVTALLGFGFFMMKNVPVGRIILVMVWFGHIAYFGFKVNTIDEKV